MKCLIGPGVCGLRFSREFVDALYAETGTEFFDRPFPKSEWTSYGEEFNAVEFLEQYDAIIHGDELFFLDNDSIEFRTSSITQRLVEEMDQAAFKNHSRGSTAEWKIIDLPEGIEFGIGENESGAEWIYEKHRTWS